jgi:hypothetical protein
MTTTFTVVAPPECDGTKQNGTRNCHSSAAWKLKLPEDRQKEGMWWHACPHHLSQVGATILRGEQGELIAVRLVTTE